MPDKFTFCPGAFTPVITPTYVEEIDDDDSSDFDLSGYTFNSSLELDDCLVNLVTKRPLVALPIEDADNESVSVPASPVSSINESVPSDEDPGTSCGFPLSEKSNLALQTAFFSGVTHVPASLGCGSTQYFELEKLLECPCFHKALGPVQFPSLDAKVTSSWYHACTVCTWCLHSCSLPSAIHSLCQGKDVNVFRDKHTPEFLRFVGTHTKVEKASLAPSLPVARSRIARMKVAPFKPCNYHRLSSRFFDDPCPHGCPSPLDDSQIVKNLGFQEYCRLYGTYGDPRSPGNGLTQLLTLLQLAISTVMLLVLVYLAVILIRLEARASIA